MISAIDRIDQDITLIINKLHSDVSDQIWMLMSDKKVWIVLYAILVYFLFKRLGWKKAVIVLISIGLAFAACDQFSNLIKYAVARLRPCYNARMLDNGLHILEGRGSLYGFFSAHAANAFSLAICSSIGFKNDKAHTYNAYWRIALIYAALVSISRVFVGKHYFGDVIVGIIIGMTIGYLIGIGARAIIRKYIDVTLC